MTSRSMPGILAVSWRRLRDANYRHVQYRRRHHGYAYNNHMDAC
jgi:hypothetical protein